MGEALSISYDAEGDILYVDLSPSRADEVADEVAPGVVVRSDRLTEEVLGFEVQGFLKRTSSDEGLKLPIGATFRRQLAAPSR